MTETAIRELIKKTEELLAALRELLEQTKTEREAKEGLDIHGDIV